jgi:hypothetical protein
VYLHLLFPFAGCFPTTAIMQVAAVAMAAAYVLALLLCCIILDQGMLQATSTFAYRWLPKLSL